MAEVPPIDRDARNQPTVMVAIERTQGDATTADQACKIGFARPTVAWRADPAAVAVAGQLGRIDRRQPHALAASVDRVAVDYGDRRGGAGQ